MEKAMPIISLIFIMVIFYLFLFIPENKRKKRYNAMISSLKVNDEIMTRGGIIGKIVVIKDDYIILESGPDKARIKIIKNGIGSILNNTEEKTVESKKSKEE